MMVRKCLANDLRGVRCERIDFKTTKAVKLAVSKRWDLKKYPKTARLRRDPKDPKKKIPFRSEREYVELSLRVLNSLSNFEFNLLFEKNNPDHPDFI